MLLLLVMIIIGIASRVVGFTLLRVLYGCRDAY